MVRAVDRHASIGAKTIIAGLSLMLAPAALATPAETGGFVASRDIWAACVERSAQHNLEDYAGRNGSGERLARSLVSEAMRGCRAEASAMRAATTYRRFSEELRYQRRQLISHYSVQIEAERASAI